MEMKAKVGDTVHVKGTIVRGSSALNYPVVRFGIAAGATGEVCVRDDDIVHVERAPLKVGDRVAWRGDFEMPGTIIAIDMKHGAGKPLAWVREEDRDGTAGMIVYLDELERADEPRQLKVGDKVRHVDGANTGTVVQVGATDGHIVQWDGNARCTSERLADLERVE
jgi:hypothetical protein